MSRGGVWGRVVWGGCVRKMRGEGQGSGEGGGWDGDRQRNRQVNAHRFVKTQAGKRSPNPSFLVRISSGWVRGFPREGVGAQKFGMSLEIRETKLFGGISQDFAGISRRCPKSLRKKKSVFNFQALKSGVEKLTRSSLQGVSSRTPFLLVKMRVLQADLSS